ncbi:MAG TPA: hypothetical protein VGT03_06265 [Candidatus Acidoferrales bacterium]|nr:hypothetical protein [Candidatus Acidoferrales bacterium]
MEFPKSNSPKILIRFHTGEPPQSGEAEGDEALWYTSDIPDERGNSALRIWKRKTCGDYRIHYSHGLEFYVDREGTSISVRADAEAAVGDIAEFLLGPVLGILLRLRGVTCLHASAVAVGDKAIAFAGPEGAGKSTTAGLFVQEGHAALSDDVVTLVERDNSYEVLRGYPYLSLWPESVEMLRGIHRRTETGKAAEDKQQCPFAIAGKGLRAEALPLGAVYLLGERLGTPDAPRVEELSPQEAFLGLIANTYANKLLDPAMRAREFGLLSRLVNHVRVRRVTPHEDPSRLHELHQNILQDIAAAQRIKAAASAAH